MLYTTMMSDQYLKLLERYSETLFDSRYAKDFKNTRDMLKGYERYKVMMSVEQMSEELILMYSGLDTFMSFKNNVKRIIFQDRSYTSSSLPYEKITAYSPSGKELYSITKFL